MRFLLCVMPNDFILEISDAPEKSWMTGFRIMKKLHTLQWRSIPDTRVSLGFLGNKGIRYILAVGTREYRPPGDPQK